MSQKKKVRLSDIAQKLNVSTVTVSKALSNKEGVGDELREQIKELADKMGYKIKQTVSEFENSTKNIGILIPSKFFSYNSSFYWNVFNQLSKELLNRNYYSIMELLSDENERQLILPRMLNDKKVDGIIILGQTSNEYLDALNASFKNFILMDFYSSSTQTQYDSVSNDDFYCSYRLTNYVLSQGHKKLKFVGTFNATSSIRDRFMGFQKALFENNISSELKDIIDDRDEKGMNIQIKLPSKEEMPTAFICNNDETAARLISQLEEKGYKIPDDISVTGFDNYISQHKPSVGLTTVYIHPEDTANTAADLIIQKITGKNYIKGRHIVSGELIIRDSVKSL